MVRICILHYWKVVELFLEKDWMKAIERASDLRYSTGESYLTMTVWLPDEEAEGLSEEELINLFDEKFYKPIREEVGKMDKIKEVLAKYQKKD